MKHTAKKACFGKLEANLQYTYITTLGNAVYSRARKADGTPVYSEDEYQPVYYVPCAESQATHRGFDGTPLIPHFCDNIYDGKEFIQTNSHVFGDIQPEYMVLSDVYGSHDVTWDIDLLYIWDIDIEVDRDAKKGFAPVEDPFNPVIAITVLWRHLGKMGKVVYGTGDYTPADDVLYVKCKNEEELLLAFISDYRAGGDYPDIITGWNVQFYDVPYLVNRCKKLFSQKTWERISPFCRMADRKVVLKGREQTVIELRGVAILDYLELYQKFTYSQQESYKLDHIAHVELKKRKISYSEARSLDRLYRENHQKFMEYNVNDVMLVDELDQKMKLIELVCALAYGAKSNFTDTSKQVRLWDIMIYHRLRNDKLQIPPRINQAKDGQYAGAYVKDPQVGMHNWVVSFDVASMYPHIIRQWNLSPETLVKHTDLFRALPPNNLARITALLDRQVNTDELKARDVCMASNGVFCRRDKEGFLPNMLKTLYDERVKFKKLARAREQELQTATDPDVKKRLVKDISAFNNQQQVRKVNLNSAYGALGSPYFRYYDVDMAEAVTISGQMVIQWVARDLNTYLNAQLGTKNEDFVIASDTDSVYVRLERVVAAFNHTNVQENVDMLNKFCDAKLQPIIKKAFEDIADYLNVAVPCMSMARECIANKGLWTAKKRYILNVYNKEGVAYEKPKLKIMGIEAVKSSTPAICRDDIKKALDLMMNGTQEDVWAHIEGCRQRFFASKFEDVAFPRSVNGIEKNSQKEKGIPIHVAGALAFNSALERFEMSKLYAPIHEGEKIKYAYLRQPNKFRSHVLSAPGGAPDEWKVEDTLDYDKQFEKAFIAPLTTILESAGWTVRFEASLDI